MELTILMPCLNEAETVAICVTKANSWLRRNGVVGEVLISDNGSTDGSQVIAVEHGARVVHAPVKGYGAALSYGISQAKGKYIIMGDCDDSYDFSDLGLFIEKLRQDFDLVMGNRFKGGIKKGAMPFLHRYLGNPVLTFLGRTFFRSDIRDFHCGLRGFKQDLHERLKLQTTGMEFASEMIVKSVLYKVKITEVPTILSPDGRSRPPHLRTWRDGWRHLRFLLMYSPTWLFKVPGFFFMSVGFLLMILTVFQPFQIIKGVFFDTNTLIFSAVFIILGYTTLTLGLFTRTFAREEGFLPEKNGHFFLDKVLSLEMGILVGIILFVAGVFLSFYALYLWDRAGFGRLDYSQILRIVIPASSLILLGMQTVLSSFFLGILKIKRTKNEVAR